MRGACTHVHTRKYKLFNSLYLSVCVYVCVCMHARILIHVGMGLFVQHHCADTLV